MQLKKMNFKSSHNCIYTQISKRETIKNPTNHLFSLPKKKETDEIGGKPKPKRNSKPETKNQLTNLQKAQQLSKPVFHFFGAFPWSRQTKTSTNHK